eukprot:5243707-Amphidinium_carterae.1
MCVYRLQVYKTCSLSVVRATPACFSNVLCGCAPDLLPDVEDLKQFYGALGCDLELVEFLADRARVFWDEESQKLNCAAEFLEDDQN